MPPSMYPETGPGPLRPADARRAVEEAIAAARERDRQLREEIVQLARERVAVAEDVAAAHAEAADGRTLAGRALVQADEAAKAGQRADAATGRDVARVFAMRWRDARTRAEAGERQLAAIDDARRRAEAGLAANAGALDAAAAAHLATLSGRKANKLQAKVDATVSDVDAPAAGIAVEAEAAARAERAAGDGAPEADVEPVPDEDLEDEVDLESVDPLLDELRSELGLAGSAEPADPADQAREGVGPKPAANRGPGSGRGRGGAAPDSRGKAPARR
jgi:hypothetical protein